MRMYRKNFGLSSARIYVTAENLFLLSNYSGLDPEIVSIFDGIDALGFLSATT